jgi:hypothetical protein
LVEGPLSNSNMVNFRNISKRGMRGMIYLAVPGSTSLPYP